MLLVDPRFDRTQTMVGLTHDIAQQHDTQLAMT